MPAHCGDMIFYLTEISLSGNMQFTSYYLKENRLVCSTCLIFILLFKYNYKHYKPIRTLVQACARSLFFQVSPFEQVQFDSIRGSLMMAASVQWANIIQMCALPHTPNFVLITEYVNLGRHIWK